MLNGPPLYETDFPNIRLGSLPFHRQRVEAACECGRVAEVHTGLLIRKYGDECYLTEHRLALIAQSLFCKDCKKRGPGLRIVVSDRA